MKKVSVIMAAYKESESHLKQSIQSIIDQTYKNIEFIIVIDNPEGKENIDLIYSYAKSDSRIKVVLNECNIGLSASLNKALKVAKGEFICRMDADDISVYNRIERQLNYIIENDYDLIGGLSDVIDEEGELLYCIKKVPTDCKKINICLKYNQVISHPTWFGKREIFESLNGYRDIPLCEDYDLTLRAAIKGFRISNINECVLKYRMTANSISRKNLFEQFLYAKYITKNYRKSKVSNIDEAKIYVKKNMNDVKARRYSLANRRFNQALNALKCKKILEFLRLGISLLFTSKDYLNKIYRLVMVSFYSL